MTIGQLIKEARKKAGLTQQELANLAGTATGTIQQYELGKRQPRIEQLRKIADALKISISYFLDIPGISTSFENAATDYKEMKKNQEIDRDLRAMMQIMLGGYEKKSITCSGLKIELPVYGTGENSIVIDSDNFSIISRTVQSVITSLVSSLGKTIDEATEEFAIEAPILQQQFAKYEKEKQTKEDLQ